MYIVICGAGEIGTRAAEVLDSKETSITIIDRDPQRLRAIEETMDVATLAGNAADAEVLRQARVGDADLVLAATDQDEVNLLAGSVARKLGAKRVIARVHSGTFLQRGFNYASELGIDRLFCPEHATALVMSRAIRTPNAIGLESVVRGRLVVVEFEAKGGSELGKRLMDVSMPAGTRLALVAREGESFVPGAKTVIVDGDRLVLVAHPDAVDEARGRFRDEKPQRKRIAILGGTPMAEWLCRELRDRRFAIRLFERDRAQAERLAERLDWVTVINADPTDRGVFDEENLVTVDYFISLLPNDESSVLAGVLAKTRGVREVYTALQATKYLGVSNDIGIDRVFSSQRIAQEEIEGVLDERILSPVEQRAQRHIAVYKARVRDGSPLHGRTLRELELAPAWMVAAVVRGEEAFVPRPDDRFEIDDVAVVLGAGGDEAVAALRRLVGDR